MLYKVYESQRSLMEPFTDLALSAAKLYANPKSIFGCTPMSQRISAAYDLMHRLGKDYVKPEFGIRTVTMDGVEIAIHERIELKKPFCELRRFKRFTDDQESLTKLKGQPAVLIVAPLSGHYATLLRDTVKTMLKDHKVYITDWTNARLVPVSEGDFHLDDYVNYVQEFIRHLQASYGNCHVMSVCQPTVPVLAAVSLMATRGELTPLSMVMMGGPIDARNSPTSVNALATGKDIQWFENHVIYTVPDHFPGARRRVYPGFLQHTGFVAMNPSNHARSHYDYFQDLIKGDRSSIDSHRKFYDEYNAVLDMDAHYYIETIKTVFQEFKLVNGTWDVRGVDGQVERVRPQDITNTALLSVEGELDDISGSGQTRAVHTICSSVDTAMQDHVEVEGAGHYGIFSGRRWRENVYPKVKAFIRKYPFVPPIAVAAPTPTAKTPLTPEPTPAVVTPPVVAPNPVAPTMLTPKVAATQMAPVTARAVPVTSLDTPPMKTALVAQAPASMAAAKTAKPQAPMAKAPTPKPAAAQPVAKTSTKKAAPRKT